MKLETKKSAVDLTELAIGIVVLGIVVSVGATILVNVRDTSATGTIAYNVSDDAAVGIGEYGNWFKILVNKNCPSREQSLDASPEYRLTSLRGQDRSVKHKNYTRTTDKGFPMGMIYSLNTCYN